MKITLTPKITYQNKCYLIQFYKTEAGTSKICPILGNVSSIKNIRDILKVYDYRTTYRYIDT